MRSAVAASITSRFLCPLLSPSAWPSQFLLSTGSFFDVLTPPLLRSPPFPTFLFPLSPFLVRLFLSSLPSSILSFPLPHPPLPLIPPLFSTPPPFPLSPPFSTASTTRATASKAPGRPPEGLRRRTPSSTSSPQLGLRGGRLPPFFSPPHPPLLRPPPRVLSRVG